MNVAILFMLLGTRPLALVLMIPLAICQHFDRKAHADFAPRIFVRHVEIDGEWIHTEYRLEKTPEWELTRKLRGAVNALLFI